MLKIIFVYIFALISIGIIIFLPAGTLNYLQAWLFLAVIFIPAIFVTGYFLRNNPEFLERRMQFREKEKNQKLIIKIANIIFLLGIIFPGFNYRYSLSNVPLWLSIISDLIIFSAYIFIFYVFKENAYASRIVEVTKGQKLVKTGPYSIIRHPMYAGVIIMYLFVPIALASYIGILFFIPIIPIIIFRILNEERLLLKDLEGYNEYIKEVKYRLIPGIW